jgi:hypothetical protein
LSTLLSGIDGYAPYHFHDRSPPDATDRRFSPMVHMRSNLGLDFFFTLWYTYWQLKLFYVTDEVNKRIQRRDNMN